MDTFTYSIGQDGAAELTLCGDVTVAHVQRLHAALCARADTMPCLKVHCAELTRLDAAAVQVLLAAARATPEPRVVAPPEAWSSAFARYGVHDPFLSSI